MMRPAQKFINVTRQKAKPNRLSYAQWRIRESKFHLWIEKIIELDTEQGLVPVEALIYGAIDHDTIPEGAFAVHKMLDAPGYCITVLPFGYRMSYDDLVFKTLDWAKLGAQRIYPISNNWCNYMDYEMPEPTVSKFANIHLHLEKRGAFLKRKYTPSDVLIY